MGFAYTFRCRGDLHGALLLICASALAHHAATTLANQRQPRVVAPVYTWHASSLDKGVVRGSLLHLEIIAEKTAELGLRILPGKKASNIHIPAINPSISEVDWRQIKRWRISENLVPVGTFVRFKEPGIWQHYKWRVVVALSVGY